MCQEWFDQNWMHKTFHTCTAWFCQNIVTQTDRLEHIFPPSFPEFFFENAYHNTSCVWLFSVTIFFPSNIWLYCFDSTKNFVLCVCFKKNNYEICLSPKHSRSRVLTEELCLGAQSDAQSGALKKHAIGALGLKLSWSTSP